MSKKSKPFTEADLEAKGFHKNKYGVFEVAKPMGGVFPYIISPPEKKEVPGSTYRGKRKHKYGVSSPEERTYNSKVYASKLEMNYRKHLDLLIKAKEVTKVNEQNPFDIIVNNKFICKYLLDFEVFYTNGRVEYIDCKGLQTPVYRIKKKLMEALYSIKIKEVKRGDF